MSGAFPALGEPFLTANVYCADHLDRLICDSIAPFWTWYSGETLPTEGDRFLWFARYRRGGEHLKVRLHGRAEERHEIRAALDAAIGPFLAALPGGAAAPERECHADQFPIDPEDHCVQAYPDRTILWTSYLCEPGTMGRQPMSADPRHAELFTRCLGFGSDIILSCFKPDATGTISGTLRMSLALKLFVAAFRSLDLPPSGRVECLRYHRDWLLGSFDIDLAGARAKLDRRIDERPDLLAALRPLLESTPECADGEATEDPLFVRWQSCYAALLDHAIGRAGRADFLADAYSKDQVLATSFKLLHAHTNQLAIGPSNEGYLCQLLLRVCEGIWPRADGEERPR